MSSPASHDPWPTLPTLSKTGPAAPLTLDEEFARKPGRRLGSYQLLAQLGKGGMGMVFRARHVRLKKEFALKILSPDLARDHEAIRRFEREIEALGRLEHIHLVRASDAGVENGVPFVVMELLDGRDLAELTQQRGPWPIAEACAAVRQAALGLQHAFERGLVHRDVKPSNLWLTPDGVVKVLDLGLARLRGEEGGSAPMTAAGMWMGTPDYMAPEQIRDSRSADIRADLYSLGCTLFHLLSGEPPFGPSTHPTLWQKREAHLSEPPPNIRQRRPDVPAELAKVMARLLSKRPEDRYQTPEEAAAALAPFVENAVLARLLTADRETLPKISDVRKRNRPKGRALGIGMMVATLGLLGWQFFAHPAMRAEKSAPNGSMGPLSKEEQIKVGILFSLRGPMANGGAAAHDAAQLAIEEVNQQGGLLGRSIVAIDGDCESDDRKCAAQAEKLISEDRVCVLFGTRASCNRKAVQPIVEKHDNLLFYPMQFEGLEDSPSIIYLGAAPNQQMIPAVDYMLGNLGKRRLFLVGSDYVFPHAANAILRDHIRRKHPEAQILGEIYIPFGSTQVKEAIEAIQEAKPDLILNTINGDTNSAFFREFRQAGLRAESTPVLSFSMGENDLLSLGEVGAGHYAAWSYFQSIDGPENQEFVRKFRERFGPRRVVSDPMETVYFGVHLWAQAVKAAGSDEPHAVREAIRGQSLDAPEGTVRVDRDTRYTWRVLRIGRIRADGQFEILFNTGWAYPPEPFPATRPRKEWERFLDDLYTGWGNRWLGGGKQP
jgi:urea transport system substrate-binding protein